MRKKYCTIEDIESYLLIEIDETFQEKVEKWIESVSKLMDNMANRRLVAEDTDESDDTVGYTTRFYDGNGQRFLTIDDCVDVRELALSDGYGDNFSITTDYLKYPRIAPIRRLILKNDRFSEGVQNVRIVARFGVFSDIPEDIRLACTVMVSGIINASTPGKTSIKSESIGNYSVSYEKQEQVNDYVQAIETVQSYRKYDF